MVGLVVNRLGIKSFLFIRLLEFWQSSQKWASKGLQGDFKHFFPFPKLAAGAPNLQGAVGKSLSASPNRWTPARPRAG